MSNEIKITCCEGNEKYPGQCLKDKCPWYVAASQKVQNSWQRVSTGYGNLYGEPKHSDNLSQVRKDVKNDSEKVK
jgi:hypothetical protein